MNELPSLHCILGSILFEEEPSFFTEEYIDEFIETTLHLFDEYLSNCPTLFSEPDFEIILFEEVKELLEIQFENNTQILDDDLLEDDLNNLLEFTFQIYLSTFGQERSIKNTENYNSFIQHSIIIEEKINKLRNAPQPAQRTNEWYQFRHNLITASNAYKAFESQATINQLIYDKCQPLKITSEEDTEVKLVNTNTPLHWGQKYEPLSVMFYENKYNTQVEDFGCIQHEHYSFIGASPDGIISKKDSDRYGRMLEIKNVVNREITGIPKKEYWVQMQLQMEVCDLDECDFLETKFIEYPDKEAFYKDNNNKHDNNKHDNNKHDNNKNINENDLTISSEGKVKGIILQFHTKEGKPFYSYKPLNLITSQQICEWEESQLEKYESTPYYYTFMKFIYWKLEIVSCVLVIRNKEWFQTNIGQLEKVWRIIERERIHGYEHRAPNKKLKKETKQNEIVETKCLLTVKKV